MDVLKYADLTFVVCGSMAQSQIGYDFEYKPQYEGQKGQFETKGNFLYLWVSNNAVLYVGMTKKSIPERMNQHRTGLRGEWGKGGITPGLKEPLDASGQIRTNGFGSLSGGKKRRFMEGAGIRCFLIYAAKVPPSIDLRLKEQEVIWAVTKELLDRNLGNSLESWRTLKLNGSP
jgi:hypothetical protein